MMVRSAVTAAVICAAIASAAVYFYLDAPPYGERESLQLVATYYPSHGRAVVEFSDALGSTKSATMEVLGLEETFYREYEGPIFSETLHFDERPKYGWSAHPVVVTIDHPTFGPTTIKTEFRPEGMLPASVVYGTP